MLGCYLPINKYTLQSVHCLCAAEFLRNELPDLTMQLSVLYGTRKLITVFTEA